MKRFALVLLTCVIVLISVIIEVVLIEKIITNTALQSGMSAILGYISGSIGCCYVINKW